MYFCTYCGREIINPDTKCDEFKRAMQALMQGSLALAIAELTAMPGFSREDARKYFDHLLNCQHAYPYTAVEQDVLAMVEKQFGRVEKPEHFTDYTHSDEFEMMDQLLRDNDVATIKRETFGNCDPLSFSSAQGIGYYMPAMSRYALLPDLWSEYDWYGHFFLNHISWNNDKNKFLIWCDLGQRRAVYEVVKYLKLNRRDFDKKGLEETLALWKVD